MLRFADRLAEARTCRGNTPLFLADWIEAVFIHYDVDPIAFQAQVPYDLDLRDGRAYVSLVAFTMDRLRPARLGRTAALLLAPIARHSFLNVRTYVRHRGEPGIYFIAEWLPNRLAVLLGPRTFGLPYRLGRLDYGHDRRTDRLTGTVAASSTDGRLSYDATPTCSGLESCKPGSIDEFLLERYTAFTRRGRTRLLFRVQHAPWPQSAVDVRVDDDRLLQQSGRWIERAVLIGGNYSPGVTDVSIGPPCRADARTRNQIGMSVRADREPSVETLHGSVLSLRDGGKCHERRDAVSDRRADDRGVLLRGRLLPETALAQDLD